MAETDYEYRDFRRAAYAEYTAFVQERRIRQEEERRWQTKQHSLITRLLHNWRYRLQERHDDEREEELLSEADPMAGFRLHKQHQSSK